MHESLTPTQVAEMTGVNVRTIYTWIRRGVQGKKLPAKKVRGRVVIEKSDLDAFLKATSYDM